MFDRATITLGIGPHSSCLGNPALLQISVIIIKVIQIISDFALLYRIVFVCLLAQ